MKILLFIVSLIVSSNLAAQSLEECGLDTADTLNVSESTFLNNYLSNERKGFDFTNRKVLFVTGTRGQTISTKIEYFKAIKNNGIGENKISSEVYVLSRSEKLSTKGFDAIVTFWVKVLTDSRKRKIIKNIK